MKRVFVALNVLVAVVTSAIIYVQSQQDRDRVIEQAYGELELVATALQEHTEQTLTALDLNLSQLILQAYRFGLTDTSQRPVLEQVAANRQSVSTNTLSFYVLDANGWVFASSDGSADINQSSTPEFLFHQASPPEPLSIDSVVHIAPPRIAEFGAAQGQWVVPVSRRVPLPDEGFAGVAVALVSLDHLLNFYDAIRPDAEGSVGLLSRNGMVIARSPMDTSLLGVDVSETSQFLALDDNGQGGRVQDLMRSSSIPRISAFRYAWDGQLIVYANAVESAILQDWRQRLVAAIQIGLLVTALFAGFSIASLMLTSRQRRWAEQTLAAQQKALDELKARRDMEERLRQSQKMDALGQLTGGIAHDFNNLLTVILGNIDELLDYLKDKPESIRSQADVIRLAGERAAELTHRLLAFARRQPLDPRTIDVNALVSEVKQLLSRTVPENINIELVSSQTHCAAMVDPHELQNALINLALNARDAMPDGGKLTIETDLVDVDDDYAVRNDLTPGHYALVVVSDTGHGMPAELIEKVFDPFFTTKAEGKGSGLGLAMVYGFAKQSNGHVKIYSEPGEGTSVRLYLPAADESGLPSQADEVNPARNKGGSERVLLVEDDDLVRQFTLTCLRQLGYQVTECSTGEDAISHLNDGATFDLLFTDVVLAGGMSGKQVAQQALQLQPSLKVLYMSGYTENAIVHHGRLDPGVHLLNKPFRLGTLAEKLRQVLEH